MCGEYSGIRNGLDRYFCHIIRINRDRVMGIITTETDFGYIPLQMPPRIDRGCDYFLSQTRTGVLFGFLHYVVKEWATRDEFREEMRGILEPRLERKIRTVQRAWREKYYSPEGGYLKLHGQEVADRWGMRL